MLLNPRGVNMSGLSLVITSVLIFLFYEMAYSMNHEARDYFVLGFAVTAGGLWFILVVLGVN